MNISSFCDTLSSKLDEFIPSFPGKEPAPIREMHVAINKFKAFFGEHSPRDTTIKALAALSMNIRIQSSKLQAEVISDTLGLLIAKKIEELSSAAFSSQKKSGEMPPSPSSPPSPSHPTPSALDREIQATEQQLAVTRKSLADFYAKPPEGDEAEATLIAMTGSEAALEQKLEQLHKEKSPPPPPVPLHAPSFPVPSALDREIQATEQQLAVVRKSLADFFAKPPEGDEAEATLIAMTGSEAALEQKLEQLQKEKALVSTPPSIHECAGLRNAGNKCYVHGCLKGLWASKKFREIVERKAAALESAEGAPVRPLTAIFLSRLFLTFDATKSSEIIEPEERAIQELLREMAKYHPFVGEGRQQDATEFLNCLFGDLFDADEALFTYVERKQRPVALKDAHFCIPAIDLPSTVRGNLFVLQLPAQEGARVSVQEGFEPTFITEDIEKEAVLTSDQNKDKDAGMIFEELSKTPPEVEVMRERIFQGTPPPCLCIHLWRQIKNVDVPMEKIKKEVDASVLALGLSDDELKKICGRTEGIKVPVSVDIPPEVTIHHAELNRMRYKLQGVIIHSGQAGSGHYYSYLPEDGASASDSREPAAAAEAAAPHDDAAKVLSFVRHDDARVYSVPYDRALAKEMEEKAYVLIYDKID